ncbi:phospholipase A1-IIdelta-like [Cornus florida]|uniref:phospholipase A1-IIdelta-like n=1 Tax=Cornus florida TaxID=4283 RepID=UPI002899C946|nr:phospholipase A1-IIdelta-like [Cornus florida]
MGGEKRQNLQKEGVLSKDCMLEDLFYHFFNSEIGMPPGLLLFQIYSNGLEPLSVLLQTPSSSAGLTRGDYQIISFLYATASIDDDFFDAFIIRPESPAVPLQRQSNWIGYVAVTTDEVSKSNGRRDIYVAWRGTVQPIELQGDLHTKLVPATPLMSGSGGNDNYDSGEDDIAKVMEGWLTIYTSSNPDSPFPKTSAQTQVLSTITKLMELYKHENISLIFTGHSLGGVLAALSAFNVVETGVVADHVRVGAFVFGCPKLGNKVFIDKLKALQNLRILHVRNVLDLVPNFPLTVPGYEPYAGIELQINSNDSPFLKDSFSPWDWHNLQGMLHVVAGWNGKGGKFELKVKRSLALVNKSSNFLKDKYQVPESWWVEKNKGMVLDKDGDWVEAKPFQED